MIFVKHDPAVFSWSILNNLVDPKSGMMGLRGPWTSPRVPKAIDMETFGVSRKGKLKVTSPPMNLTIPTELVAFPVL